jgi:hypothetical protein
MFQRHFGVQPGKECPERHLSWPVERWQTGALAPHRTCPVWEQVRYDAWILHEKFRKTAMALCQACAAVFFDSEIADAAVLETILEFVMIEFEPSIAADLRVHYATKKKRKKRKRNGES